MLWIAIKAHVLAHIGNIMLRALRDAEWLNHGRVRGYTLTMAITFGVIFAAVVATSSDMIGPRNIPIGSDFVSFRAAAALALDGRPEDVYRLPVHRDAERALFAGRDIPYYAFFYPPPFLLVCLPLALLSYPWALAAWLTVTGYAFWRAVRRLLPSRYAIIPILGFPAVWVNAGFGQNGLLSAALLGSGALLLPRRPILAGLVWGGLAIKPHLGILIPVVLIAARAWRALAAAAISVLTLIGISWAVLGTSTWRAFFATSAVARMAMEEGGIELEKMQSVFAIGRIAGLNVTEAYLFQAASAVLAITALTWVTLRQPSAITPGIALMAATPLASPFLLPYDLAMLGFPIAWLTVEGLAAGFRPWEKITLFVAYLVPLLAVFNGTKFVFVPWTPCVSALLLAFVIRRFCAKRRLP
jgi:alpha-1,2-mannosyltransferase